MKKSSIGGLFLLVAAMAIMALLIGTRPTEAASCDATQLTSCLRAVMSPDQPTAECCQKLKQQEPCFCEYMKNPNVKPHFECPNAKKIAASCGITIPTC